MVVVHFNVEQGRCELYFGLISTLLRLRGQEGSLRVNHAASRVSKPSTMPFTCHTGLTFGDVLGDTRGPRSQPSTPQSQTRPKSPTAVSSTTLTFTRRTEPVEEQQRMIHQPPKPGYVKTPTFDDSKTKNVREPQRGVKFSEAPRWISGPDALAGCWRGGGQLAYRVAEQLPENVSEPTSTLKSSKINFGNERPRASVSSMIHNDVNNVYTRSEVPDYISPGDYDKFNHWLQPKKKRYHTDIFGKVKYDPFEAEEIGGKDTETRAKARGRMSTFDLLNPLATPTAMSGYTGGGDNSSYQVSRRKYLESTGCFLSKGREGYPPPPASMSMTSSSSASSSSLSRRPATSAAQDVDADVEHLMAMAAESKLKASAPSSKQRPTSSAHSSSSSGKASSSSSSPLPTPTPQQSNHRPDRVSMHEMMLFEHLASSTLEYARIVGHIPGWCDENIIALIEAADNDPVFFEAHKRRVESKLMQKFASREAMSVFDSGGDTVDLGGKSGKDQPLFWRESGDDGTG